MNAFTFNLLREMDRILSDSGASPFQAMRNATRGMSTVFPKINLAETEDHFVAEVLIPGVDPNGVEISILNDHLTITGERKHGAPEGDVSVHRTERFNGRFNRVIALPGDVDTEKVTATYNLGVLKITAPKAESAKPRKIAINTGSTA